MFSVQFLLLCLAGLHKVIAWTAAATFVAWTWYFIDMHRIRYSHYGKVCFGDYLPTESGVSNPGNPYLVQAGAYFNFMLIT